jgi:cytochrome c biogenesis protein
MNLQAFIWVLSRMTTAIYGLLLVALASVAGTLLVQGESTANYDMRFGEFWSGVFQLSGLTHLFSSWWFLGCCAFIALSVSACLLHSGRLILRKLLHVPVVPKSIPKRLEEIQISSQTATSIDTYARRTLAIKQTSKEGFTIYRLGRLNRIGYFVLHISILGVIASAFVSGVFGYRGIVNLTTGKGSAQIIVPQGGKMRFDELPFTIVNRGFDVQYYASGIPKFYETKLDIVKGDALVLSRTVQVNKPVRVGSYTLYQSDFGDAGSEVTGSIVDLYQNKINNFNGNIHGVYEDENVSLELINAPLHVTSKILEEGAAVAQTKSDGAAVDYVVKHPSKGQLGLRSYLNQPDVIGIMVEPDVYTPVFLGLSLDSSDGWDVVESVISQINPDDEIMSPQRFSALANEKVKAYPKEKRLSLALKALQTVRVIQQFDLSVLLHAESVKPELFSGIQVSYDPAVHAFWVSSVLLLLGVLLMIYFPHGTVYCVDYKNRAHVFVDAGRYTNRLTAWILNIDASH